MLKEGQLVYYLVGSRVDQGHVIDIEQKANGTGFTFRIDSFGGCEGQYVIDSSEIGLSVFLTEEEADAHWGNGHGLSLIHI